MRGRCRGRREALFVVMSQECFLLYGDLFARGILSKLSSHDEEGTFALSRASREW